MRASLLEHLEELRWRLIASIAAIVGFSVAAYFFSGQILEFYLSPLKAAGDGYTLYFHSPYEAFLTRLKVSLLTGVLAASPVLFTELWLFVAPGLHKNEKKKIFILILSSVLLFLGGVVFAFMFLVPWGLNFFLGFQTDNLRPLLGITPYFSFLVGLVLACGVFFDLPILILGLVAANVLNVEQLKRARKWVIVFFFLASAMITPTTDPVTQILLTLPLILFYEICIWISGWMKKKEKHENPLRRR